MARRMRIAAGLALTAAASAFVTATPAFAADPLVSLGRPATASSARKAPGNAVDGRATSSWQSAATRAPQWLRVDLGAPTVVSKVSLSWAGTTPASYRVEYSADGRYVTLRATPRTTKGLSLYELQVYGHPAVTPGPGTPPGPTGPASAALNKETAMRLVSSAENSSLDWRAQYAYLEDIGDGRGYTGGIIGFCSGTGDMLDVVTAYTAQAPGNPLAAYLPALRSVNGTASHAGLGTGFEAAWRTAAADPAFQRAQDGVRDRDYYDPAVAQAKLDGLRALGQFAYYDAMVMHGPGDDGSSFGGIRTAALARAKPPAQGGDETAYLTAFLDARVAAMRTEEAHSDTSRVDTAQRVFLTAGNLTLTPPLTWKVYGDPYTITA